MRIIVTVVVALLGASVVRAHHSFSAEFDAQKPVNLRGTVAKVELINPHSWIHIDVTGPDGAVTRWMVEGPTPNGLFSVGLTKNSLPIGSEIRVAGYRARDGSNRANGRSVTFADGRKVLLGGSGPE